MKKLQLQLLLAGLALCVFSFSQTHVTGTIDSETWTRAGSPYIVDDDLFIANLVIEPGVRVMATGDYVIEVAGILDAVGAPGDSIYFTTTDTIDAWQGIWFNVTTFDSELKYCKIENASNSGVRIINSTPVIQNCLFLNNTGTTGGAIYLFNDTETGSEFVFSECSFMNNQSTSHGGAVYVSLIEGHAYFVNSLFEDNISNPQIGYVNSYGGALYVAVGDASINNSEFIGNMCNSRCSGTFGCNVYASGGAVYFGSTGTGIIENTIFLENTTNAVNSGGCNFGGSTFSHGAAVYIFSGIVSISNVICAYNSNLYNNCRPNPKGGGIYVNGGDVSITNCVVTHNPNATGIECAGDSIEVKNSIVFFNNAESTQIAGKCKVSYSDVQDGFTGEGNISNNPVFVSNDSTFHLTSISPCIDKGNPEEVYNDICFPPSSGSILNDMGAYGGPVACGWLQEKIIVENDLAVEWLAPVINPECGTRKEEPIVIRISNNGNYAVSSFRVEYSIDNGENYVNETVYESIAAGGILDYTFRRKADMADEDIYYCIANVNVAYDIDDANNMVSTTIENDRLTFTIATTDTDCGQATGAAELSNIEGRPQPYYINWTTGDTDMGAEKLVSGIYSVTVTDALGCSWTKPFTINDVGAPEISAESSVNAISCFGMDDGNISIVPTGGSSPYTFQWSNGATSQNIQDLRRGEYDVTITDTDGCAKNHSFSIDEPAPLIIKIESEDAVCGEVNGTAQLSAVGGTIPYSFKWNSSTSFGTETNLAGGLYTAIVTDSEGCIDFTTVSINEIDAPQILVTSVVPASCNKSDGGINISVADASLQYDYSWSDGSTNQDIQNVPAGEYSVTLTSEDGACSAGQIIEVPTKMPSPGEICMITVDSITDGNTIVLKQPENPDEIFATNVYNLSKTGSYQFLNSINPSVSNTVADAASNNETTSYRYRITQVDGCGNESEPSTFHETMHTVVSPDFNLTRANLFWNSYKGFDYSFFQIYRYSDQMGREIIDTVPKIADKDFYTFTDLNPPSEGSVYYVIVIELPEPCSSIKKASTHNTVRSNKSEPIDFNNGDAPIADFIASPTTITLGESIMFTDLSTNSPAGWSWDFGDGISSTSQSPTYTYSSAGTFTVTLTATNESGSNAETKNDYITVNPGGNSIYLNGADRSLNIYPNPNRGTFNVSIEKPGSEELIMKVFDAQGRLIWTSQYNAAKGSRLETVKIPDIVPGIYNLQLLLEDEILSRSFVVE